MHLGGVGFSFKWNMGWMNDTLHYFEKDPVYRRHEHSKITFSFMYAWSENFVLPISHDEVVHGKKSLLDKMPGDEWQKRANYRLFMSYMTAHPGKKLMFMGSEFGQWHEWREHEQLDWPLLQNPAHRGLQNLNRELAKFYKAHPQLHASDCDAGGFRWSDLHNADESVFAFLRQEHGHAPIVCVFNATPVPREDYWLGVPDAGRYEVVFDSDHPDFGGAGFAGVAGYEAFAHVVHGFPHALRMRLPPLGAVFLRRCRRMKDGSPDILGATFTGEGVNFAVRSRAATRVDVCLYDSTGERETARLTLPGRTGARASRFRRAGAGARRHAVRHPRARRLRPARGLSLQRQQTADRPVGARHRRRREVASVHPGLRPHGCRGHSAEPRRQRARHAALPGHRRRLRLGRRPSNPRCPGATRLIYELHVKGFTQLHPDVPPEWRGKYLALTVPAVLEHLKALGVTAVELMPVHAFTERGIPARARPH